MNRIKKAVSQLAEANGFINGLTNSPPPVKTVTMDGQNLTIAQLIGEVRPIQQVNQEAVDAKTAWKKTQAAVKAASPANRATMTAIRRALILAYGKDTAGLSACGITVATPAPRTAKDKAISAARALQTRQKNGTAKKPAAPAATVTVTEANGQVIGQSSAPVVAPSAPASPAPAVAAGVEVTPAK